MAGFAPFHVSEWKGERTLFVPSDNIDAALRCWREQGIEALAVSPTYGYRASNLDFLKRCPELEKFSVQGHRGLDVSAISHLRKLKSLTTSDVENAQVDLDGFPALESYAGNWNSRFRVTARSRSLRTLRLRGFKPKSGRLDELPALRKLKVLELTQGNLPSLEGVSQFRALQRLGLFYNRKLESLSPVGELPLRQFEAQNCPRLGGYEALGGCAKLRKVLLDRCGPIASLSFLSSMPRLNSFVFAEMDLLDGDISPLLDAAPKYTYFTSKKHFSHKIKEVWAQLGIADPNAGV